jgi:hypothetical protein
MKDFRRGEADEGFGQEAVMEQAGSQGPRTSRTGVMVLGAGLVMFFLVR